MVTKKRSDCKRKLRKCCTKNQLEALDKKKVKRCCCIPGGAQETSDSLTRGSSGRSRGIETNGERRSGGRDNELSARDVGSALMGGLSASIGGSMAGGIR